MSKPGDNCCVIKASYLITESQDCRLDIQHERGIQDGTSDSIKEDWFVALVLCCKCYNDIYIS